MIRAILLVAWWAVADWWSGLRASARQARARDWPSAGDRWVSLSRGEVVVIEPRSVGGRFGVEVRLPTGATLWMPHVEFVGFIRGMTLV